VVNKKEPELEPEPEPETQFVISAPGGNLILAPRLSYPASAPQHCIHAYCILHFILCNCLIFLILIYFTMWDTVTIVGT
jgi:hypothetical protein